MDVTSLFSTENFMPHGHCYLWFPHILWLHVISDALIALAYFAIPLALFRLARRRPDFGLNWAIYLFVLFIVLCGLTHVMAIYTIWEPVYFPQGLLKSATALASVATAIAVWPLLPRLIATPSVGQLEKANQDLEKAYADLKTSDERLELAVRGGGVGLWDWNVRTNEVWYSDVWFEHLGYKRGELDSKFISWEENLHPDDAPRAIKEIWDHLTDGTDYKSQFRMKTKSGEYIWVEAYGVAERDQSGQALRMAGTLLDITEKRISQKEDEKNRLFLSAVLESVQDGIIACNEKGDLTVFNLAARQFHGLGSTETPPEDWSTVYNLYESDGVTPLPHYRNPLYRALNGEIVESQNIVIAPKNRSMRWVVAKASPLRNAEGQHIGAVAGIHDTTLEREREEALRRSNNELENFARVASHDLQEPLRKLITFSEFLKEDLGEDLNERVQGDLDAIRDSAARMKQLVSDILELSRLKGRGGPLHKVSPVACIRTVLEQLPEDSLKGAEFVYDVLPDVMADETLLTQVYQNLIVNAVKFVPKDRRPRIAFTAQKNGRKVILGVEDNGIGIDSKQWDYVFQPLARLHSRDEYDGTGIGLAICRKAIERMGGQIWIEGAPEGGTRFLFELKSS